MLLMICINRITLVFA